MAHISRLEQAAQKAKKQLEADLYRDVAPMALTKLRSKNMEFVELIVKELNTLTVASSAGFQQDWRLSFSGLKQAHLWAWGLGVAHMGPIPSAYNFTLTIATRLAPLRGYFAMQIHTLRAQREQRSRMLT